MASPLRHQSRSPLNPPTLQNRTAQPGTLIRQRTHYSVQQPHWHLHLFFGMSCNRLVAPRIFESLVSLCVRAGATVAGLRTSHLRTRNGDHEIDLIVENTAGRVVAIEAKLTRDPDDADVRHLHWLGDRIGGRLVDKVVVTTGEYAYRRDDGVAVIPLGLLS